MKFPKGVLKHPINKKAVAGRSKVLPPIMVSTWDFGATHPQSERRLYGTHPCPAKMRPALARAILQVYGEEPVLDPMCGSGTTNIAATLLGFDNYGVDIEEKYVEILRGNLKKLPNRLEGHQGSWHIECADARDLSFMAGFFSFILFSPPYWTAIHKRGRRPETSIYGKSQTIQRRDEYSDNPDNLGNLTDYRKYWTEMLKVYQQCYRVLDDQKLMVVVVKDINKDFLTVPIGADTIKTCQKAGFKLFDVIINKMYFPAFWMVHYFVKQQENGTMRSLTTHEYVLVFQKCAVKGD